MGGGKPKEKVVPQADIRAAAEQVAKPTEAQTLMDDAAARMLRWNYSKGEFAGQPKDVTQAPGFENYLDIYGNAEALLARNRIGSPSAAFSRGAHPGFAQQLEKQKQMERYNTRASALSRGLQELQNQALGMGTAGSQAEFDRNKAYYDALIGQASEFTRRPVKQPFWQQALLAGIGSVGVTKNFGAP